MKFFYKLYCYSRDLGNYICPDCNQKLGVDIPEAYCQCLNCHYLWKK